MDTFDPTDRLSGSLSFARLATNGINLQGRAGSKVNLPPQEKKIVMSAQMLEVSLSGVGTVLRLEREAWSMVK